MKLKLKEMVTRSLALILSLCVFSGAWATDYVTNTTMSEDFEGGSGVPSESLTTAMCDAINASQIDLKACSAPGVLDIQERALASTEKSKFLRFNKGKTSSQVEQGFLYKFDDGVSQLDEYEISFDVFLSPQNHNNNSGTHSYFSIVGNKGTLLYADMPTTDTRNSLRASTTLNKRNGESFSPIATKLDIGQRFADAATQSGTWYTFVITRTSADSIQIVVKDYSGATKIPAESISINDESLKYLSFMITTPTGSDSYNHMLGLDNVVVRVPAAEGAPATPAIAVTPDVLGGNRTVTLTTDAGATIYYRTSSADDYIQYTEPFEITSTVAISAYAVNDAGQSPTLEQTVYAGVVLNAPSITRRGFTRVNIAADQSNVAGGAVSTYTVSYKGGTMAEWANTSTVGLLEIAGLDSNGSELSATVWSDGFTTSPVTAYSSYSFGSSDYNLLYSYDYLNSSISAKNNSSWDSADDDPVVDNVTYTGFKSTVSYRNNYVWFEKVADSGNIPRWDVCRNGNPRYGLHFNGSSAVRGKILFYQMVPGTLIYLNSDAHTVNANLTLKSDYSNTDEYVYEVTGEADRVNAIIELTNYAKIYAIRIYEPVVASIGDTIYNTVGDVTFDEKKSVAGDAKVGASGTAYAENAMVWQTTGDSADYGFTQTSGNILVPGGEGQTGRLEVKSGTYYTPGFLSVGAAKNGTGYLTLSGGKFEAAGEVSIGVSGDYLDCENCSGTVKVNGGTLVNHGWFCVGRNKNVTANLEVNGGVIRNEAADGCNFTIGTLDAKSSTMTVNSGSVYAGNNLYVGEWNSAELTVNGGEVTVDENLVMGAHSYFRTSENDSATMYLNGGTLSAMQIKKGDGNGPCSVVFNGGTFKAATGSSIFGSGITYTMGKKGLTIDPNGNEVTVDVEIAKATEPANLLSAAPLLSSTVTEADYTITVSGAGAVTLNKAVAEGTTLVVEDGAVVTVGAEAAANIVSVVIDEGNNSSVTWPATVEAPDGWTIDSNTGALVKLVELTLPAVENATAKVMVGETEVAADTNGKYTVPYGAEVTVTWTAADGYAITANATQEIASMTEAVMANAPTVAAVVVTLGQPSVTYGDDYEKATVQAAVSGENTDGVTYELTVTKGGTSKTYTGGTVANGTVTFVNVEVPRTTDNIYADITYTVTPKSGSTALTPAATTEAPMAKTAWSFESKVDNSAVSSTGGSWGETAPAVKEDKLSFTDGGTFTATKVSSGDIVVITMDNICFCDVNAEDVKGAAQAGVRIGQSGANYTFQVYTAGEPTPIWQDVATSETVDPAASYKVVVTINYSTGKYSVAVNGNLLTAGSSTSFELAGTPKSVSVIEFCGEGSFTSIAGEAFDGNMVVDKDGNKFATIKAAIAALEAGTATAPLTLLHPGTAPDGWTIEKGVLTQASIVVESTDKVTLVAVPEECTADALINLSNRLAGDMLQVNNANGTYWSWELDTGDTGLYWKKVARVGAETDDTPEASACTLKAGAAVWVTRKDVDEPIVLNATYAAADEKVEVAVTTGWTLVAPLPKTEAFDLKDLSVKGGSFSDGDMIVIPGAAAPINCVRKGEKWMVYTTTVEVKPDAPEGWGPIATEASWVVAPKVPAGKGFFFVSESEKTLEL